MQQNSKCTFEILNTQYILFFQILEYYINLEKIA